MLFLSIVQIVIACILIIIVILQGTSSSTASLVSSNTYNSMFSNKSAKGPLNKLTIIVGSLLFINSLIIGIFNYSSRSGLDELSDTLEQQASSTEINTNTNSSPSDILNNKVLPDDTDSKSGNNAKQDDNSLQVPLGN